jgi:2-phospho-L-lactate/phosphoenolpyruvate guanylyltransferase
LTQNWAVIPVKGLTESKKRLSSYLGERKKLLVEALLQDVLSSVLRSDLYDKVLVVSPDENVADLSKAKRVIFLQQTGFGLNRAIEQANRLAIRDSVSSLTTILGDIPLAEPQDFREIFKIGNGLGKAVMVPSLKGGTNVMMTRPPGVVKPNYGRWSYSKHLRQAQLNRVATYSISNPRVSFDVDTVNDLIELKRSDPSLRTTSAKLLTRMDLVLPSIHVSC